MTDEERARRIVTVWIENGGTMLSDISDENAELLRDAVAAALEAAAGQKTAGSYSAS